MKVRVKMGSRMMHYTIGTILARQYNLPNEFLLGTIAPDVQKNMKVAKDASHFLDRDSEGFGTINLHRFHNEYQKEWANPFVQGYYCHLLADDIWLRGPINQHMRQLGRGSQSWQEYMALYYADFHSFNAILVQRYHLTPLQLLTTFEFPIIEINTTLLPALVADLTTDFQDQLQPLQVLTETYICNYLQQSVECYQSILSAD